MGGWVGDEEQEEHMPEEEDLGLVPPMHLFERDGGWVGQSERKIQYVSQTRRGDYKFTYPPTHPPTHLPA